MLNRAWLLLRRIWWALAGIFATVLVWRIARRLDQPTASREDLQAEREARRRLDEIKQQGEAARAEYRVASDKAARRDEAVQSQIRDALADPDRAAGRRRLIALERELFGDDP